MPPGGNTTQKAHIGFITRPANHTTVRMAPLGRLVVLASLLGVVCAAPAPPDDNTPLWRRKTGGKGKGKEDPDAPPPNKATARPKKPAKKPTVVEGAEERAAEARAKAIQDAADALEAAKASLPTALPTAPTLKALLALHTDFVTANPSAGGFDETQLGLFWTRFAQLVRDAPKKDVSWIRLNKKLFNSICAESAPAMSSLGAAVNAEVVHSFAVASMRGDPFEPVWQAALATLTPTISELGPKALARLSWAVAAAAVAAKEDPSAQLIAELAAAAMPKLGEYEKVELSQTAWAFATSGLTDKTLYEAIADEVMLFLFPTKRETKREQKREQKHEKSTRSPILPPSFPHLSHVSPSEFSPHTRLLCVCACISDRNALSPHTRPISRFVPPGDAPNVGQVLACAAGRGALAARVGVRARQGLVAGPLRRHRRQGGWTHLRLRSDAHGSPRPCVRRRASTRTRSLR